MQPAPDTGMALALGMQDEGLMTILIIAILAAVVLGWVLIGTVGEVLSARAREITARELAAYVAEGSITPEFAERLINARATAELRESLATKAAEGWISSDDVRTLLRDERAPPPRTAQA